MTPDPKPEPRVVDRRATLRKLLVDRECRACGEPAANGHHLIPKGAGRGDDVDDNVIPLCGSGTTGCHGALHGNPYFWTPPSTPVFSRGSVAAVGQETPLSERRDSRWVRERIAARLRPEELAYVLGKLGDTAGIAYLERCYFYTAPIAA